MKQTLAVAMLVAAMAGSTFAQTPSPSHPTTTPAAPTPRPSSEGTMPPAAPAPRPSSEGTMSPAAPAPRPSSGSTLTPAATPARFQARNIIGASVKNTTDETIGDVKDLLITSSNNVAQAIISVGGFLGLGETLVAVPYDKLEVRRVGEKMHVMYPTTKAELAMMPKFTYPPTAAATSTVHASKLLGANIKNNTDNTIGEIKDLVITGDDKVPQAIVSVGGFLGIGDKLVAVPYTDLRIVQVENEQRVVYNATKEQLKELPSYTLN